MSEDSGDLLSTLLARSKNKATDFHPIFPESLLALPHAYKHTRANFKEKIFFELDESSVIKKGETRNNERIPFTFTFQISNAKYWNAIVGRRAVNREGNRSKICDKRVHVNATRYARRPQICGGPLLYPGPGYIGMCKVFPRASDLQGFSKINGYA